MDTADLTDRELMDRYLEYMMGKALERGRVVDGQYLPKAKRGERMDAYRNIALNFGVEESTPRMWRARGNIPRHIRRQIEAELDGETGAVVATERLDFDAAVLVIARDVQAIYDLTRGKGEVWRSLGSTVQLAKTWAKRGRPAGQSHLRALPRSR